MFCSQCGEPAIPDARFCVECGAALSPPAPDAAELPHFNDDAKVIGSVQEVIDSTHKSNQTRTREPNVLKKHWRGDYSLGFAYWVIGVLLTIIVIAISMAIGLSSGLRELGARASGAVILAFYAIVVTLTVWQIVGIWRSADKHSQRGGKVFWAGLAKVMVVLGLLRAVGDFTTQGIPIISEGAKLFLGVDETPPYQIRLLRDGHELELAGGMPFGTAEAVKNFLDAAPAVQVIHLNSKGGRVGEAYKLYKIIKERRLITYTSTECASACSLAFLAGRERYLGESGRMGFHSLSIGGLSGTDVKEINDEVRKTLQSHGIPDRFVDRALSTSPQEMWYPSKEELLASGVIDSIVDSRYFGLSGVTQWRDAHKVESTLLSTPLYSALAEYDQQNYVKLRNVLVSGIQKGRSQIEIQNDMRSIFVDQLIPTYLRKAPDGALVRYWNSQIAEMKYLAGLSPQHCADFAFPQFAKSRQDLQRLLPTALQERDADALLAVVKGVATNPQDSISSAQILDDLEAVRMGVEQHSLWAIDVLQNPADYEDDPASLCWAVIALYSEVLKIPDIRRSGPVLRHMFSE